MDGLPRVTSLLAPHLREREYIFSVGRALMQEKELNEVLRIILEAVINLLASRAGLIFLLDQETAHFRTVASYGISWELLKKFRAFAVGIPLDQEDRRKALIEMKESVRQLAATMHPEGKKALIIPLYSEQSVIGAICVFQDRQYEMPHSIGHLVESFATWATIAVKNAQLYQTINTERNRWRAIIGQTADGVMILGPDLGIVAFNPAFERMTSLASPNVIGKQHHEVIHWQHLRTENDLDQAISTGWSFRAHEGLYVEGELNKADGKTIPIGITYSPIFSDHDRLLNIIAIGRDLTRYRDEEKLHKTFISVISHELKTPVAIIKGYAGTLQRDDGNWPREIVKEYLQTIVDEADSLTNLIDNLLEASRLQAGTFALSYQEEISLPLLAKNVVKKFTTQTKKHRFTLSFSADFPEVAADERRLIQVLNNLISNAIKYSPDGGEITLSGEQPSPNHIIIHIADEGIGIPAHEHHRIFQQFSRLDNALSRKTEGTGLGLFLSRAIILAHGGQMQFADNPSGKGTIFSFSLPIKQTKR